MSLLRCNRYNCGNILCDLYSEQYGYICNECFDQLLTTTQLSIAEFMETDKNFYMKTTFTRDELMKEFKFYK